MAKAGSIFLSVVIAAYNAADYIEACIDSVWKAGGAQTEIVVVLGDSKDRTNEVCRRYEQQGMVSCVMQDGKGLSNARNCGMRRAAGTYLTFVDADDWVITERFRAFVQYFRCAVQKKGFFDVLVNDFLFADPAGKVLFANKQIQKLKRGQTPQQTLAIQFVASGGTFWNAWRYVYRTAYLKERGRRFLEGHTCEDLEFTVKTLLDTQRIAFVHMPYYCYCPVRPLSLMHSKDIGMVQDFSLVLRHLFQICIQEKSPLAQAVLEKLKELLIWKLPDIWEVEKKERHAAIQEYVRLLRKIGAAEKGLEKWAGRLCIAGGMPAVSRVLYWAKWMRRICRYHEKPGNTKRRMHRC